MSLFLFVVGMTNGPKIFSLFLMALLTISSILVFPYYMQQPEGLEPSEILIFLFSLIPLLALLYSFVLALCVVMLLVCHEEFLSHSSLLSCMTFSRLEQPWRVKNHSSIWWDWWLFLCIVYDATFLLLTFPLLLWRFVIAIDQHTWLTIAIC